MPRAPAFRCAVPSERPGPAYVALTLATASDVWGCSDPIRVSREQTKLKSPGSVSPPGLFAFSGTTCAPIGLCMLQERTYAHAGHGMLGARNMSRRDSFTRCVARPGRLSDCETTNGHPRISLS
jgi:hypothetical protein